VQTSRDGARELGEVDSSKISKMSQQRDDKMMLFIVFIDIRVTTRLKN
jgi:hypothetical protein